MLGCGKQLGTNDTITSEGAEDHEEGDIDDGDYDPNSWIPIVVGEVLAIVKRKCKQKGKSKGQGLENVAGGGQRQWYREASVRQEYSEGVNKKGPEPLFRVW